MRIGVVGYGVVGRHMVADIQRAGHHATIYDPFTNSYDFDIKYTTKAHVNDCDAAFVCVGTPQKDDGTCDVSAVEEVFSWLEVPLTIVRSTVPPGTIDRLDRYSSVFVPEFIGEGVNAPYNAMKQPPFLIIGGPYQATTNAASVLSKIYNAECEFIFTDAVTAELAKYAENYFLALKVSWANELYDIATHVGADFNQMMVAVTHDYRIGRSHTHVYPEQRGWGGRCLPKDTAALLARVGSEVAPLLAAVRAVNEKHRGQGCASENFSKL